MLEIRDLYKRYGKFTALDGLNLEIGKGELFGFVGPNGAGKTTTMRIMAGLLKADSGSVRINGVDAVTQPAKIKEKIGYMPDFFGVYDNLKAMEYMEFYASIYGIEGLEARELCRDLMKLVNLEDKEDAYVDGLSRGMKQRLCLARSLVHNPELLILDEPASGLDPRARFEMKEILKNLSSMGKTIIISSHILPELAEMCTSIGIIEHGKMVVKGTVDDIMSRMSASNPLLIRFASGKQEAIQLLKENPAVKSIAIQEDSVAVGFGGGQEEEAHLLAQLVTAGIGICHFGREEGNLESLFMQLTKEDEDEG
ncbi:ABC transporter ATP-binding protein [Acetivibrio ethanolgignens]|uniref:ABC transporter n=1 Tax=Acetivibrio ethanolgignens TaxID=290052 RepID=A0A0V8QDE9_9FIRM|nr:ABC transporter ATP-binding protein [Acetivibrio ethanolgignens]KSV58430.1 ABC transporter [Acetivibrio ethanolgignens]